MKKYKLFKIPTLVGILLSTLGCNKLVDLKPINEISDASYWKTENQYKLAANEFYTYLRTFTDVLTSNPHSDLRSDLLYSREGSDLFSSGTNTVPLTDANYNNAYTRIRAINYLLIKAETYANKAEIAKYIAEAKFFRAYIYFDLLQQFGGVPIIKTLLSPESPELQSPQNTRDEVVDFIISDLEAAIIDLPLESAIALADKGRISKAAAQGILGRVTLYEGTWQKFRNNLTRANALLDKSIVNSNAVITANQYQLFAPVALGDSAQKYMFILESQQSNPANITKSANNEYIIANKYEFTLRQIRSNITHQLLGNVQWGVKKFMDMYLMQDGLPIDKSPLFKGYKTTTSEFEGRDTRMKYSWMIDGYYYWDNEAKGSRVNWTGNAADLANSRGKHVSDKYAPQKFATERKLVDSEEAYDFPVLRLAEVFLNYAEALFERNGSISDADLDKSLNLVRNRINKKMPKLSNAFVATNGLKMQTEIRRERTVELFIEGFRRDDLIRWKTADVEMPLPIESITWTGTPYETRYPAYKSQVVNGIYRLQGNRVWADKNYLLPFPSQQLLLNPNLKQNAGW